MIHFIIIIWITGWLLTITWYLVTTLIFYRTQRPEHRRRFVEGNMKEALFAIILWPVEAGMIVVWLLFNGRGRGR